MTLPKYEERMNPRNRVQLYCDKCKVNRYAELTSDFPGNFILENSNLGDYIAICGVCGKAYKDGYNMGSNVASLYTLPSFMTNDKIGKLKDFVITT